MNARRRPPGARRRRKLCVLAAAACAPHPPAKEAAMATEAARPSWDRALRRIGEAELASLWSLGGAERQALLLGYLLGIAQLEQQLRALQPHPPHPPQLPREGPASWREPHA
jgi:hypothetical protein